MGFVNNNGVIFDFDREDSRMTYVHEKDKGLVKLLDLNIDQGPWLAGGAVLNWFNGEPVGTGDFDIFFKDLRQFDEMFGRLMRNHATIVYTSENALTLKLTVDDDQKTIQLIRKTYFQNAKEVIDHFDFTICQLATDGYSIVAGEKTYEHVKDRKIALARTASRSLVKRLIKYVSYGYKPDQDLGQNILDNNEDYDWQFNNIDENYENAF